LGCEQAPAGRAIKELAESEVACFLFAPSSTREPVHRLMHIQLQCKEIQRVSMIGLLNCSVERLVFTIA